MNSFHLPGLLNKATVFKAVETSLQDANFSCFYLDLEVVVNNVVIVLFIS